MRYCHAFNRIANAVQNLHKHRYLPVDLNLTQIERLAGLDPIIIGVSVAPPRVADRNIKNGLRCGEREEEKTSARGKTIITAYNGEKQQL